MSDKNILRRELESRICRRQSQFVEGFTVRAVYNCVFLLHSAHPSLKCGSIHRMYIIRYNQLKMLSISSEGCSNELNNPPYSVHAFCLSRCRYNAKLHPYDYDSLTLLVSCSHLPIITTPPCSSEHLFTLIANPRILV